MSKFVSGSLIIIISGLILSFHSCTPQACFDETVSYVKVSFYNDTTNKLQVPDSLTIYGLNRDTSKLYHNDFKIQPAKLPLNSAASSCTFIIKINDKTDTVEFKYTSFPHLISKECGYTFYHTLDTELLSTKHAIIRIHKTNRNITTLNGENIGIYF